MTPRVAFALVVGPGERTIALDTLNRIRFYYPQADIWVRDDCTHDGAYDAVAEWALSDARAFVARNAQPAGFWNLPHTLAALFLDIANAQPRYDLVIKLDTDAVLMGDGLTAHFQTLFERFGPGAIGSYETDPDGTPRNFSFLARKMQRDFWPLGVGKKPAYLRLGRAFYWRWHQAALRHGYRGGEHVQGGLYALSGETLQALKSNGFLDAIPAQCRFFLCQEDALMSLGVKSLGHALIHANQPPNPGILWTMHPGPLTVPVAHLRELGVQALHPCKNNPIGWAYRDAFAITPSPAAPTPSALLAR